jgi:hypothetical protein
MASHRQHVIDIVKQAAQAVNYSGTFLTSSRNQLSLYAPNTPAPWIHLFNDFRLERITSGGKIVNNSLRRSNLLITFMLQDTHESTPDEEEALVNEAEALCESFVTYLQDSEQVETVSTEPVYRLTAGVLTGISLTITILTDVGC